MRSEEFRELLATSSVVTSAKRLLGCEVVHGECRIRIVEAEAYWGSRDAGSHAFRGPTPRTAPMFGLAGHAYVYFTYGNHWMLNVTCRPEGEAGAVLIRGALPLDGREAMARRRPKAKREEDLLSGPGKIAAALGLDGGFSGLDMLGEGPLQLVARPAVRKVLVGTRIGLAPGKGDEKRWRFIDAENARWASRPRLP